MSKEKEVTIDALAVMVQKGFLGVHEKMDNSFEQVDKQFEQIDGRFEQIDKRFDRIEGELSHHGARLSAIEHDVADIKRDMISRDEFEDLMGRVKYLEIKMGIESGK